MFNVADMAITIGIG
ncbi:MAG: hypothetical protein ACLUIS_02910 [Longibaculum sp.]